MREIDSALKCWYQDVCNAKHEKCREKCSIYGKMNFQAVNSGMPNAYQYLKPLKPMKAEQEAYKRLQEIKDNILDFTKNGNNLLITSIYPQTGKTSWSIKLMYKYFDELPLGECLQPKGYFVNVPLLISRLRSFEYWNSEEFKEIDQLIKSADFVIWDNLTGINYSVKDQENLSILVEQRFNKKQSNIFNGLNIEFSEDLPFESIIRKIFTICENVVLAGPSRVSLKEGE